MVDGRARLTEPASLAAVPFEFCVIFYNGNETSSFPPRPSEGGMIHPDEILRFHGWCFFQKLITISTRGDIIVRCATRNPPWCQFLRD